MKTVVKVIAIFLAVVTLTEIVGFAFFLMRQPDTFTFNIGLVVFLSASAAFGYLGLYLIKLINPDVKEEIKKEIDQNKKEKLN